jgi:CDP-diacylglycerol---serine O-phosphatidyltransferase
MEKLRLRHLLPNAFTTSGLFSGFYAVIAAFQHDVQSAFLAICVAMLMDTLDGRIARATGTQTEFGKQLDSLSDLIAFGMAPSLLAYNIGLQSLGKIGWLAAFFFTATGAVRLARFNTFKHHGIYFQGLPIPIAGGLLTSLLAMMDTWHIMWQTFSWAQWCVLCLLLILGCLMSSRIAYFSFKTTQVNHWQARCLRYLLQCTLSERVAVVCAILMIMTLNLPLTILCILLMYVCSGQRLAT